MAVAIVTGAAGLIGAEAVRFFGAQGLEVVGVDNDMRRYFFGDSASTRWSRERLEREVPGYRHQDSDIRDQGAMERLFARYGRAIQVVVHTAAQPSHDWAAREPATDFSINAGGTMTLLEATRHHAPEAVFLFTSTNKVYGDTPNRLPLVEGDTRWEIDPSHPFAARGIDESMSIDHAMHSVFGVSKVAADVMVQEYGRYFGMRTACLRGGCLTGSGHAGAELHGFLSYLVRCAVAGTPYVVNGCLGKQVRDNINARDLVAALWALFRHPPCGEAFNIGGGRFANCSVLEAIAMAEQATGRPMTWSYVPENRRGDHIWWISDTAKLEAHCPDWRLTYDIRRTIDEIAQGWLARLG